MDIRSRFLKRRFLLLLIPVALIITAQSCMQFRMSDKKVRKSFSKANSEVDIKRYKVGDRTVRYLAVGDSSKPMLIYIHGAPGSSQDFIPYLQDEELADRFFMVVPDRPGYGYSDLGKSLIDIEKQAELLSPLLNLNRNKEKAPLLVAHSYGGPVAARMAMAEPEKVGSLLMLATAISPDHEKIFFFNKPIGWPPFRMLLPAPFRVANDEKLSHEDELRKMLPLWEKLPHRTRFVHGYKDKIVPFKNSPAIAERMTSAKVDSLYNDKMNHLIIFNSPELIKEQIFDLADE